MTKQKSFTMLELVIVITLIALLATTAIALLNPQAQIGKSWDVKRKGDLATLKKVLEDFYNDRGSYPKPTEICYGDYPDPQLPPNAKKCYLCGSQDNSPSFSPYLNRLPCDPQHPTKDYLYQVDDKKNPTLYQIYTLLYNTRDPAIAEAGCQPQKCPQSPHGFNYGAASPNTSL